MPNSYNMSGFQSTSPVWRTTSSLYPEPSALLISIHVPRVEDDSVRNQRGQRQNHFNPRPPCGGRRAERWRRFWRTRFQSTSPVWRTTSPFSVADRSVLISIHVPRVEDDSNGGEDFRKVLISIHVPRVEDDTVITTSTAWSSDFNPRPPCGGRL